MKYLLTSLTLMAATFLPLSASNEPIRKIASMDYYGSAIELDDSSIWKVAPGYEYKCRHFNPEDRIVIYPVIFPAFSGNSKYYFVNQTNQESINLTNVTHGPELRNPKAIFIEDMDYAQGYIWLVNNQGNRAALRVSQNKIHLLRRWCRGNCIIIGSNTHYKQYEYSDCNVILINIEKGDYIPANYL